MTPTKKLFWETPKAAAFTTEGAIASELGGKPSLVLPETLFYAEGGGQLGDRGTLSVGGETITILDVQSEGDGIIHHLVERVPASLVGEVRGSIDRARRDDFTVQHSAQHALSRALADEGRAKTVSARLGTELSTIDIDVPGIADGILGKAEDLVNDVIASNVIVRSHFPTPEELAKMPLRKDPTVTTGGIRIIEIDGLDLTPCGGTHVERTGEMGSVAIVATEKYKGMIRITFLAGKRARADAKKKHVALTELARSLSCGPSDIAAQIEKLRGDASKLRADLGRARGELAALVADAVRPAPSDGGTTFVAVHRDSEDVAFVRALAAKIAARADVITVCTTELPDSTSGELAFVIECGENTHIDAGAIAKALIAKHGGKGGGRGRRAEGRIGAAAKPALAALNDARALQEMIGASA